MKAFRMPGRLSDERAEWELLWERGCLGLMEERSRAETPSADPGRVDAGRPGTPVELGLAAPAIGASATVADELAALNPGLWTDGPDADDGATWVVAYFEGRLDLPLEGSWEDVPEVDWVAAYLRGLGPVRAGALVVAPTHTRPTLEAGEQVVWLDPGSAFGTGHHETTRMALEALAEAELVGRSVLDVGSGSGILAIAADRLGAAEALGVDIDPATLEVARRNALRNRSRARFLVGSLEAAGLPARFDLIVANLYAEIHARLLPAYAERLVDEGRLLLTGILESRADLVRRAVPGSLEVTAERADGPWLLLALRRRGRA